MVSSVAKLVVAVVPIHNGLPHVLECLGCLSKQDHPNLYVVVVDDGSSDGSAAAIRDHYPNVTVLNGDGNLWWGGAINKGTEWALARGADYVVWLNHDNVVEPTFASSLVRLAEGHPDTLIGSVVMDRAHPDTVAYCGAMVNWWRGGFVSCPAERAAVAEPDIIPVDVSGGMGVIVARAIVERIGLVTPPPSPNTMETMTFGCARERGESRRA